jgi:hypothetical protein
MHAATVVAAVFAIKRVPGNLNAEGSLAARNLRPQRNISGLSGTREPNLRELFPRIVVSMFNTDEKQDP